MDVSFFFSLRVRRAYVFRSHDIHVGGYFCLSQIRSQEFPRLVFAGISGEKLEFFNILVFTLFFDTCFFNTICTKFYHTVREIHRGSNKIKDLFLTM